MSLRVPQPEMEDDKIGLLSTNIKHDSKESGAQKTSRNGNNKSSAKHGNEQLYLDVPTHTSLRPSLDTLSNLSIFSVETNSGGGVVRSDPATSLHSRVILSPRSWKVLWAIFWQKNKGLILVLISQLFGALMNVTTRLLETDGSHGEAMYPFQVGLCLIYHVEATFIRLTRPPRFYSYAWVLHPS